MMSVKIAGSTSNWESDTVLKKLLLFSSTGELLGKLTIGANVYAQQQL